MKYKNFFIAFALYAVMQPGISFCTQEPQKLESKSYWQQGKEYAASWVPQSVKDTVNGWSARKKIGVATAIIGSLLLIGYNKDNLIQLLFGDNQQELIDQIREAGEKYIDYNAEYNFAKQGNQFLDKSALDQAKLVKEAGRKFFELKEKAIESGILPEKLPFPSLINPFK